MNLDFKENLSKFMTRRTDPGRLSKGRSIFSRRSLKIVDLDFQGTGLASFNVNSDFSGITYQVEIRNFLSPHISTSCSCPDDGAGLCKHRVAAILYILNQMPETATVSGYNMAKAVVELPSLTEYYIKNNTTREVWKNRNRVKKFCSSAPKTG